MKKLDSDHFNWLRIHNIFGYFEKYTLSNFNFNVLKGLEIESE